MLFKQFPDNKNTLQLFPNLIKLEESEKFLKALSYFFLLFLTKFLDKLKRKALSSDEYSSFLIIFVEIYPPIISPWKTLHIIIHFPIQSHFS